ncbi:MAG: hypothetical protein JWM99_5152, partial [Verrucomicrobiales bacterium]|nr:hypothetical protein [Verrucomicrobiales bacterium]
AKRYWDGSITDASVGIKVLARGQYEVRYNTLRGVYYRSQSTPDLSQPFTNDPPILAQPFDSVSIVHTNTMKGPQAFHRVIGSLVP